MTLILNESDEQITRFVNTSAWERNARQWARRPWDAAKATLPAVKRCSTASPRTCIREAARTSSEEAWLELATP